MRIVLKEECLEGGLFLGGGFEGGLGGRGIVLQED